MGIYIKGMDMPSCCMFCPISNASGCGMMNPPVLMTSKEMLADRPDWCPLVPVPPHGRLIDADAVIDLVMQYCPDDDGVCSKAGADLRELLDEIENLPTVIPAEEEP